MQLPTSTLSRRKLNDVKHLVTAVASYDWHRKVTLNKFDTTETDECVLIPFNLLRPSKLRRIE